MLIEALSEFIKQASKKTYDVLTDSNNEQPEELCGVIDILPSDYNLSGSIDISAVTSEGDDIKSV